MAIAIYPVVGHWIWGGGWLQRNAASSTSPARRRCTRSAAGRRWSACIILGPRIGKYTADGKINAIPGHNLTAATIGCFVLWFGWFGFNPGSTMAADPGAIAEIAVTTNMAAAAATLDRHGHGLDDARQARLGHDAQRLPGRAGGDHGARVRS